MLENLKYKALKKHFEAEKERCIYQLTLSFKHPVAVGEHPTLLEDDKKLLSELAHAEECLESLEENFGQNNLIDPSETPEAPWIGVDT